MEKATKCTGAVPKGKIMSTNKQKTNETGVNQCTRYPETKVVINCKCNQVQNTKKENKTSKLEKAAYTLMTILYSVCIH